MKVTILTVLLLMTASMAHAGNGGVSVPQYGRFEAAFTITGQTGNPFDPAANDVAVAFRGPRALHTVPAFWDGDTWKVRFTPTATGSYTGVVSRNGAVCDVQWSTPHAFKCVKSKSSGFVRRSSEVIQGFVFDNGKPFYPLGINEAWGSADDGKHYEDDFALMHGSGLRWARVWMTFWDNKALEWRADGKNPAIGDFSLDSARKLDRVVDAAENNGVYVQLVLQHHGQYTSKVDPNWAQNPFNVANGGFLKEPQDFFTDPRAIALTKAKYRYIAARWGYSPSIMSWELFNEVQNISETKAHFADVVDWHKQMADYLRSVDINHHLITASYTNPGNDLSQSGLDYFQIHDYVPDVITYFSSADYTKADKPTFVGEWGSNWKQTEQLTHDGVWSSLYTEGAAPGMFWYWDMVESQDWWHVFASPAAYLSRFGVDQQIAKSRVPVSAESPGKLARLQFAFPGGWESTTSFDVDLAPSGTITGLAGISSFVQGSGHRDMTAQPIVFHLHGAAPVRLSVGIGRVASGGAHPTITVDGMPVVDRDYPGTGKDVDANDTLGANVGPGDHEVALFNAGADWFTVSQVSVENYAPALAAMARTDGTAIDFWVYDRERGSKDPIDGALTFHGIPDGRYKVRLWDTWNQVELPSISAHATGGSLVVPINGLVRDWAGTATRQ